MLKRTDTEIADKDGRSTDRGRTDQTKALVGLDPKAILDQNHDIGLPGHFVRFAKKVLQLPLVSASLAAFAVLIFWQFGLAEGLIPGVPTQYIGSPATIWSAFVQLASHGYQNTPLWIEIGVSLTRTLVGFSVASAIAVPVGLVIGFSKVLDRTFVPLISFLRPVPALAFIPLVVIWFGLGEFAIIFVIFMSSFLFTVTGAYLGARSVPTEYLMVAKNYRLSYFDTLRKVVLPPALPQVLSGVRTGLMVAWAVLVAAELIGASQGLGFMVQSAAQNFQIADVYVAIFFIGIIGVAFEFGVRFVEKHLLHWTTESR